MMMSQDEKIGVVCVAVFSFLIGTATACIGKNHQWQREAIQHGAAEYDSTTGAFRWKDGK